MRNCFWLIRNGLWERKRDTVIDKIMKFRGGGGTEPKMAQVRLKQKNLEKSYDLCKHGLSINIGICRFFLMLVVNLEQAAIDR